MNAESQLVDRYPYYSGVLAARNQPQRVVAWGSNLGATVQVSADGGTTFRSSTKATLPKFATSIVEGVTYVEARNQFLVVTSRQQRPDVRSSAGVVEVFVVNENP